MIDALPDDASLKAKLETLLSDADLQDANFKWFSTLETFISQVKNTSQEAFRDVAFLERLWDENPVAHPGSGTVKIAPALSNQEFVDWFVEQVFRPLPADPDAAEVQLVSFYNALSSRLKTLCQRRPLLKIQRVLCVLYPEHFTSIVSRGALLGLHVRLGGEPAAHVVHAHIAIRRRLDPLQESKETGDTLAIARRICMPWLLWERLPDDHPRVSSAQSLDPSTSLQPLPATRRRKGLTGMRGSFEGLLAYLPAINEGLTREEFIAFICEANPNVARGNAANILNQLESEFDVCHRIGDIYQLTTRGIRLLNTRDPDELADHLLTHILGVDHVLDVLRASSQSRKQLVLMLMAVNTGWTKEAVPVAILGWLQSLGVIEQNGLEFSLLDRGKRWAERLTWTPENLPRTARGILEDDVSEAYEAGPVQLPAFSEIVDRLTPTSARLVLDMKLVAQLHIGLWSHPMRHFAVLSGISGSGKTQLAQIYAKALCGAGVQGNQNVRIIPVQPGWYDPSPLLGHVNPISDAYRSAPFLELLLEANQHPNQPFVAILDEMNLSHPEQYLAPILSAMETGAPLDLHHLDVHETSVPPSIPYPENLAIIGTLNMDETTHGLSDKVLDRAYTLEFWDIKVEDFPGWTTSSLPAEVMDQARQVLIALASALAPVRLHFGWRTIEDVLNYLAFESSMDPTQLPSLDNVIYAKVLPKLRGETSAGFQKAMDAVILVFDRHGLDRCSAKTKAMREDLSHSGSTRFWR